MLKQFSISSITFYILCGNIAYGALRTEKNAIVAEEGKPATFKCMADVPIRVCRAEIPGMGSKYPQSPPEGESATQLDLYYEGGKEGYKTGECSFTLRKTRPENEGVVKCAVNTGGPDELSATIKLTVTRSPNTVDISIIRPRGQGYGFKSGTVVEAVCQVKNVKPPPEIIWKIGDSMLYVGRQQPVVTQSSEGYYTVSSNVNITIIPSYNNKPLSCEVAHIGLPEPLHKSILLNVAYAPLMPSTDKVVNAVPGSNVSFEVIIDSNPVPNVALKVGEKIIPQGSPYDEGKIHISPVVAYNNQSNNYKTVISIINLTDEDFNNEYKLLVNNTEGSTTYPISLSMQSQDKDMSAIFTTIFVVLLVIVALALCFIMRNRGCLGRSGQGEHLGDAVHMSNSEVNHNSSADVDDKTNNQLNGNNQSKKTATDV